MRQKYFLRTTIALQLFLSACGHKEAEDKSDRVTVHVPAAEAEAIGHSGPLELKLRIFKTKIKSEKEPLRYQIQLRNIGQEDIPIFDAPFLVPTPIEMHGSVGVSLLVTGPDGKFLKKRLRLDDGGAVLVPGSPSWPIQGGDKRDEETKKKAIDAMWADREILRQRTEYEERLLKSGASQEEVSRKSLEFDEQHPLSGAPASVKPRPSIMLKPGASITTLPWTQRQNPDPERPSEFTEFVGYWYTQPGQYRIKAAFDERPRGWVAGEDRKHGISPRKDAVLVETNEIKFEVVP